MGRLPQGGEDREEHLLSLDELARQGARRMSAQALEIEVQDYLEAARGQRDEQGHALVVRNGHAPQREVLCGAGSLEVKAPRVNDRRVDENGERNRFKSVILPPYIRRSPKVSEVLPLLYLHGLSSGGLRSGIGGVLRRPGRALVVSLNFFYEKAKIVKADAATVTVLEEPRHLRPYACFYPHSWWAGFRRR